MPFPLQRRRLWIALAVLSIAAAAPVRPQDNTDYFNTNTCQTPERDDQRCGPVHWGWGDCPGERTACDWCYGPNGVFAYVRRTNKTYKLSSTCERLADLPAGAVEWPVSDPDIRDRMERAGGSCVPKGGIYLCQVDANAYRRTGGTQSRSDQPGPDGDGGPGGDRPPSGRGPRGGPPRGGPGGGGPGGDRPGSGTPWRPGPGGPGRGGSSGGGTSSPDLPPSSPCASPAGPLSLPQYDVYPIRHLPVLDSPEFRGSPGAYGARFPVLTNGTFFAQPRPGAPYEPVGSVLSNDPRKKGNRFRQTAFGASAGRGAVAVFSSGFQDRIEVGRQSGNSWPEITARFGANLSAFMGGGALLIESGAVVGTQDLLEAQRFTNPSRTGEPPRGTNQGLHSAQMNSALHVLVGARGGETYLLVPRAPRTGSQIQRDLCAQGFQDVVMFDGGHGFAYYKQGAAQPGTWPNLPGLTGLGVEPKR